MEEPIKILYLHIYEDKKTKKIRKLLEENYGKDNVISSKDKSRVVDIIILVVIYFLCLCCILLIFHFLFANIPYIYMLIMPCFFVTMSVFFIASTIIYEILYRRCLGKANKLFDTLKPNVIVGYQFGCILAMHLSGARVPMVTQRGGGEAVKQRSSEAAVTLRLTRCHRAVSPLNRFTA